VRSGGRQLVRLPLAALAAIGVLIFASVAVSPQPNDFLRQRHVVEIRGMAFHPEVLELRRGDTVVWINRDIVPHTATATRKAGWDMGSLLQGESGRYVPRRKGEEPYFCRLHPTMLGTLIVQ